MLEKKYMVAAGKRFRRNSGFGSWYSNSSFESLCWDVSVFVNCLVMLEWAGRLNALVEDIEYLMRFFWFWFLPEAYLRKMIGLIFGWFFGDFGGSMNVDILRGGEMRWGERWFLLKRVFFNELKIIYLKKNNWEKNSFLFLVMILDGKFLKIIFLLIWIFGNKLWIAKGN